MGNGGATVYEFLQPSERFWLVLEQRYDSDVARHQRMQENQVN
jgi:hypothetical protein